MNLTEDTSERSAGILLHISSLPGSYPCGDFGPEAYTFAKKLKQAKQKYWQILPLNPLDPSKGFSPYSPLSAFAGNTLFISPELLAEQGFPKAPPKEKSSGSFAVVDYRKIEKIKYDYLHKAFRQFSGMSETVKEEYTAFCLKESFWLDDFALYNSLRRELNLPWYQWPVKIRDRDPETLKQKKDALSDEIDYEKFTQFLFTIQWNHLKEYCHQQGVNIIGDIPIYTSHDSADVWSHPGYFKLTAGKAIRRNAGVPPDYFNEKGQLWNMPVYDWQKLAETRYRWWIERLAKNLELYDIVRLDHFRGFSSYWEVDGRAEDAIKGKWIKGPGKKLFDLIKMKFPEMPFIAEDLGDIDKPVFELRDHYELPGMRILQFAFEDTMHKSIFIPHNYTTNSVVYTGTHDNNTVRGWFRDELNKKGKKNLTRYIQQKVTQKNVHELLIREAYRSVAKIAVLPMQDILGLGSKHRMNFPSTETGNWLWRLRKNEFGKKDIRKLKDLCLFYARNP